VAELLWQPSPARCPNGHTFPIIEEPTTSVPGGIKVVAAHQVCPECGELAVDVVTGASWRRVLTTDEVRLVSGEVGDGVDEVQA